MSLKMKNLSPLVESVLSLDAYLSEIARIGSKIETMDLKTDADSEHMQKLMSRFAECSEGISAQIVAFSKTLQEARTEAEHAAEKVARRSEEMQSRQNERQKKMESFRLLGEKVRDLTLSLQHLKPEEGTVPSPDEQARIGLHLAKVEAQLQPLITEARDLRADARVLKLKEIEQKADALAQSLTAVGQKLEVFKDSGTRIQ